MSEQQPDYDALAASDPVMAELIARFGEIAQHARRDYFIAVVRAIVGQQLSVKAAKTIYERLESKLVKITSQSMRSLSLEAGRAAGLSQQKYRYLQDLAHKAEDGLFDAIDSMSDDQARHQLTSVHGVGSWTAEMFLMFTLHRPDIFPVKDLGLRRAIEALYGIPTDSDYEAYEAIAQKWSPQRTLASQYLWKSLDNMPKP